MEEKWEGSSLETNNQVCPLSPKPEEEALPRTMAEELGTPERSSAMQIINNVLGRLKLEGSDLKIVHLKAGEEVEKKDFVAEDVPEDGGLEARKVDSEGEEVPQEAKNNQPSPRAF